MKKVIILGILCVFTGVLSSQDIPPELIPPFIDCETNIPLIDDPQMIQQQDLGTCVNLYGIFNSLGNKFIPSQTQPIIYIRLNLIFLQRDDSTGNFQENNSYEQALINDVISYVNTIYANWVDPNDASCLNGYSFLPNTRIQFVIGNKLFVNDSYGWDNRNDLQTFKCPGSSNWYLNYLDDQIVNNSSVSRGINVYFTEDSQIYDKYVVQQSQDTTFTGDSYSCSQYPDYTNYYRTSKVHMLNKFSIYNWQRYAIPNLSKFNYPEWESIVRYWYIGGTAVNLAHELGHSLGLGHSYICNTLMNPSGGSHNFLPPLEIGKIHAALTFSNLRSFIPIDTYVGIKQINTNETWYNMRLYNSLDISSIASLTSNCDVIMPYQSNIQISGSLTINNSNIQSIQNIWNGIIVKSGGLLVLNNTNISDYNIKVESGGTIHITGNINISGNHNITVESGGYYCFESGVSVELSDYNSIIKLEEDAINGVNPFLSIQSNCISTLTVLPVTGFGSIVDYGQDVYIQNETISTNRYVGGKNIYVGNHVTSSQTTGDVIINNDANVIFDGKDVTFDDGFECVNGSTYEVVNH